MCIFDAFWNRGWGASLGISVFQVLFLAWMTLGCVLGAEEEWVAIAEREMAEIVAHPDTTIVEGLSLQDNRDGLWRLGSNGAVYRDAEVLEITRMKWDRHTLAFAKRDGLVIRNCRLSAELVEEALKFSACRNVVVENCIITGGTEDAVDIVRGENYYFRNVTFETRGEYAATIKCGVRHVRFIDCRFTGSPSSGVFVDLGNWGDYNIFPMRPTGDVALSESCRFELEKGKGRFAVRTLYADPPQTAALVQHLPGFVVQAFFQIRRWQSKETAIEKYGLEELRWSPSGEFGFQSTPEKIKYP